MPVKDLCFLLNTETISLTDINPNTTILQYLREHLSRVGSKEGCASGDCGACTVVIGEVQNGRMHYRSVNACITLLPCLHGKQLITVEDLKQGERLHPVQQSMVDCHGSQCGFCTPGFVMSMFALQKTHANPTRQQVVQALSGNLCRCTGYRSIMQAALSSDAVTDRFSESHDALVERLQAIPKEQTIVLRDKQRQAFAPQDLLELSSLLIEYPEACIVAGGTDLCLEITQNLRQFDTLISTLGVKQLTQVDESETFITLGAAARYSQFAELISRYYPQWGSMIERLGSLQIRNQGTLGGNIANASPIGDMPPVLIALGSTLRLRRGNKTRELAVEDFFLDYKVTALHSGEFIESIQIPKPQRNHHLKVYKVSKRFDDDISAVLMALHIEIVDEVVRYVRVAFGGLAAKPERARNCETALLGQQWCDATLQQAMRQLAKDFTPLSDVRASSTYRMQTAQNLLRRAFIEINTPRVATQVACHA